MRRRSKQLPALLLGCALVTSVLGLGTVATAADPGSPAPAGQHTAHTAAVSPQVSGDDPDGDGYIPAVPPVTGVTPSTHTPLPRYHKEFQADCAVTHTAPDDPIVYPGQPGKSHYHTFMGNTSTDAGSTTASPYGGDTTCLAPADASAYWMPSL